MRSRIARTAVLAALILVAVALRVSDSNPAMAQTQSIGAWRVDSEPMMDGSAPEWQSILPVFLPTTAQQTTPPMGGGGIERVAVRAAHFDERLYVMLEWADHTRDDLSDRYEAFTDAAAIQFPAVPGSEVPAICMGQADQAVNIWQWRSDQQRPAPTLPANGYVDSYPFTDDLYFTARAAGNPLSQESRSAVQSLVAGGFGTLEASEDGSVSGNGVYRDGRWMVVFSRPFPSPGRLEPELGGDSPVDVAFAVWDGSSGERDGIKSVSAFTRLTITSEEAPRRAVAATEEWPAFTPDTRMLGVGIGVVTLIVLLAVGGAVAVVRRGLDRADG